MAVNGNGVLLGPAVGDFGVMVDDLRGDEGMGPVLGRQSDGRTTFAAEEKTEETDEADLASVCELLKANVMIEYEASQYEIKVQ